MIRILCSCIVLLLAVACHAAEGIPGPARQLDVFDEFTQDSRALWNVRAASNVQWDMAAGQQVPGVADSLMQVTLSRKPDSPPGGPAWFTMDRELAAGAISPTAEGIRLLIGSPKSGQWWIQVRLRVGDETYAHVFEPIYPDRMIIEHLVPFEAFKSSNKPLTRELAPTASHLGMTLSVPTNSLYLDRIGTYHRDRYSSWLSFASSQPEHNTFGPGEKVMVTLTPGGTIPPAAVSLRYEVRDYFERLATAGTIKLDGSADYRLDLTPATHGYYEIRAWWTDASGKDVEPRSCIRGEGSQPPGVATFAVMARSKEQNTERFKTLGAEAFFGLHGDVMGVADLMGLSWRFGYSKWPYIEPNKPDRSANGMAPWATKIIEGETPQPEYRFHILPFCSNLGVPAWAKNPEKTAPPYANWEDFLAMVRDSVAVEKHRYPHMSPRIYGAAWEINLNMPPHNFSPPYTPEDVEELHRRMRQTIKAADPEAIMLGPCPSNLNTAWFEKVFKAGVLRHLDGIETHAYAEGVATPEQARYPEKLDALKRLVRQYNDGKALPIYITEAAFRGMLGSEIIHREQARLMARQAIIFKGEGVKVFLPFFVIDYDRDGWWGFYFNLAVDAKSPWSTRRISPKPTVNAMATCADVLEGAKPLRRVSLGQDVWAYLFDRQGTSILAIWTPMQPREVSLPAGDRAAVEVIDMMGHASSLAAQNGKLQLTIDQSPRYVIGLPEAALP